MACDGSPAVLALWLEGEKIAVELTEQLGFRVWRNSFDEDCVQLLTAKTGSSKSFAVFWKMLAAAMEEESATVGLRLLSSAQLEEMRCRSGKVSKGSATDNRYLILTHEGEFDAVNYPLILLPSVEERPEALRQVITRLQSAQGGGAAPLAESLRAELHFAQQERERHNESHRRELAVLLERVECLSKENQRLTVDLERPRLARKPLAAVKQRPFVVTRPNNTFSKANSHSTKRKLTAVNRSTSSLSKISRASPSRQSLRSSSLQSAQKMADSFLRHKQKLALLSGKPRPPSFAKTLPKSKPKTLLK